MWKAHRILGIHLETRYNSDSSYVCTSNNVMNLASLWGAPFALRGATFLTLLLTRSAIFFSTWHVLTPFPLKIPPRRVTVRLLCKRHFPCQNCKKNYTSELRTNLRAPKSFRSGNPQDPFHRFLQFLFCPPPLKEITLSTPLQIRLI